MKIAVVTCYKQKEYVRAKVLRSALADCDVDNLKIFNIRNDTVKWYRYLEVFLKLIKARLKEKPDVYLLTFRGYEMLIFLVLTLNQKPIIFDELINFTEWMQEHDRFKQNSAAYKVFRALYGWFAGKCELIIADTQAHAYYSAELNKLPIKKYVVIPVGTDESVFYPKNPVLNPTQFNVFYYVFASKPLPLHGLEYVIESALELKDYKDIKFTLLGGGKRANKLCIEANKKGAHISHEYYHPFNVLAADALASDVTIAGPLGGTLQSSYVITGKTYQFLALGRPVLIGRNKANTMFSDKQNALIVTQASSKAITKSILWAKANPKKLEQIGFNGRKTYEAEFSSQEIVSKVKKMVEKIKV
jgi:glycosyltransferase involved in cell wall biosynthesis